MFKKILFFTLCLCGYVFVYSQRLELELGKKGSEQPMQTAVQQFENDLVKKAHSLFTYSMGTKVLVSDGDSLKDGVTITLHGSGANKDIGRRLKERGLLRGPVIIFNFPDHDIPNWNTYDFSQSTFGTIDELLPPLFLMKQCLDHGIDKISLYGFSAGGGATVNLLAVLNSEKYAHELERIGITHNDRGMILEAVRKGLVLLDCPLKSADEIIAARGAEKGLVECDRHYRLNEMRPIDRLDGLEGLDLNILLYFELNDEVLSNRDDQLFIDRLKTYNAGGATTVVTGSTGGHNKLSQPLWDEYKKLFTLKAD